MAESSPNSAAPSVDFLRAAAAQQGVLVEEDDLQAVLGFLTVVLPRLAELEEQLPKDVPA